MKELLVGIAIAFPFIVLIGLFVWKKVNKIIDDAVDRVLYGKDRESKS